MKAKGSGSADVAVIGGGIIGLAIALELRGRGATVTVVGRNPREAASQAAAGMIAPQAERLSGPLQELALASRALYPDWIGRLERQSGTSAGYWPCGILAPTYDDRPDRPERALPPGPSPATWIEGPGLQHVQPGLGADVRGAWWYPEDAQVDNRALWQALHRAARAAGIALDLDLDAVGLQQHQGLAVAVQTAKGAIGAKSFVVASGAWTARLLPLPVFPVKGQMLALRPAGPLPIQRVLFGSEIYLVPRRDGRLFVGATVESVGWQPGNTPAGVAQLLARARRLYPDSNDWTLEEIWWGYRPGTPDGAPILGGYGACDNVFLAVGHGRHGILLAPITARVLADLVEAQREHPLLAHFGADRFLQSAPAEEPIIYCEPKPIMTERSERDLMPAEPNGSGDRSTAAALPAASEAIVAPLTIAGRPFTSRLMTGSGKYADLEVMKRSLEVSACSIVTVAVRRVQTKAPGHEGLARAIDWGRYWMLPNTAGCKTAEEAIRVARLGREMAKLLGQEDNNFVKLEVIPDSKYLLPDPIGTLRAAEKLVKEGFAVLPYINADPLLAKRLEEVGCATVMPLGSPIGSGQGIRNAANIEIIVAEAKVPVVVDAGIGTPSEAAYAMELGADALLINSAIALARDPVRMALAMRLATEAGYLARQAGRIPVRATASPSSPTTGLVSSE